jgi:hypothetical protein
LLTACIAKEGMMRFRNGVLMVAAFAFMSLGSDCGGGGSPCPVRADEDPEAVSAGTEAPDAAPAEDDPEAAAGPTGGGGGGGRGPDDCPR